MGSSSESLRFLLQQVQCRPHTLLTSPPSPVLLTRGLNHKLGFHFKTYPCGGGGSSEPSQTVTLVVRVKDDCRIHSGSLKVGDRIVGIGDVSVTGLEEGQVRQVFNDLPDGVPVLLHVSTMSRADPSSQIKRFLSVNSGASGGSQTASVDSAERPQVKRFQKSSSTETPPSPLPPSPSLDSPCQTSPSPDLGSEGIAVNSLPARRVQCCTSRECPPHNNRPGPLFTRSAPNHLFGNNHHYPAYHYHSLPDRMEGDIILTDDIVVSCETDGPSSLPPVLTPLPNTPTTPSFQLPPGGVFVNTGIGGASSAVSGGGDAGIGSGIQQQPQQQRSLGVEVCRAPGCHVKKMCLWHRFVYACPQYVVWEPFPKTVVLEKHDRSSFGFKYKVKQHDGPPAEVFALVTEVTPGGVAWNLLLCGDWIRSLDGTPVSSAREAHSPDFRKMSSLRLVIQRPEGLSRKGTFKLQQLANSLRITLHIPPPLPSDIPEPSSDNGSLSSDNGRSKYSDQMNTPPGEGSESAGKMVPRGRNGPSNDTFDPLLDQYPRQAQSPGEHIPLETLSRPALVRSPSTSERCVLPQARIVVCGAHGSAVDFVRGLLGEQCDLNIDPEAPVQTFNLCLRRGAGSRICVRSQRESLTTLMECEESYPRGAGQCEERGEGEEGGVRAMNAEVFLISDERFFHHCCPWLLPSTSLLLLTFPVHKLLNQPQGETRRLAAMAHTAHASGPRPPQILLYGVCSGAQRDASAEEVQGMFYVTDSGSRLLERHGLAVNVAVPTRMDSERRVVFESCQRRIVQGSVQCLGRVVDALTGVRDVRVCGREVEGLVTRALGGEGDFARVRGVMACLLEMGWLMPTGNTRGSKEAEQQQQQEYLLPFNTFQAACRLLLKQSLDSYSPDSRQKWFRLMTTGRVSRSEMAELLAGENSGLTVDVLELLGIAFTLYPASNASRDSGFGEDARGDVVIPYFLPDVTEDGEREEGGFVLRLERSVSWRGFYDMLCRLSALTSTEEVSMQSRYRCAVRYNGCQLVLTCRSDSGCDVIFVAVGRSPGSRESLTLQELERLFSSVIPPAVPFRVQGADSGIPSSNLPSADFPQPAPSSTAVRSGRYAEDPFEETLVKPVVEAAAAAASGSASDGREDDSRQERGVYSNLPLTELPWSLLNQVALLLTVAMPTGHDWKSVADRAGKSMTQISAYEAIVSREVPAMNFLREWVLTGNVQQFLDILEELERPDVRDLILSYLRGRTEGS